MVIPPLPALNQLFTGTAAGIISLCAYFPDVYLYTTIGNLLDKTLGIIAYKYIFIFIFLILILSLYLIFIINIYYYYKCIVFLYITILRYKYNLLYIDNNFLIF